MKKQILIIVALSLVGALMLGLVAFGGALLPGQAQAQVDGEAIAERTITVSGLGRVNIQPDMAIVRFGVQTEAEAAAEALEQTNMQVQEVISATLDAGIAEENIQTEVVRLEPVREQTPPGEPLGEVTGFRATNIVEVTVSDINELGSLLDTVVQAGANLIESVRFEVGDPEEVLNQAREQAFQDALDKAMQLAQLAGASLGEVLVIRSFGDALPPTPFGVGGAAFEEAAVPIAPGTQTVESNVEVTWRLVEGQ